MTLALYRRRAFRKKLRTSTMFGRAFDKAVTVMSSTGRNLSGLPTYRELTA
jgi:hypothetical protein